MTKVLTLVLSATLSLAIVDVQAGPGDTTIVQTFSFEEQLQQPGAYKSPGRRWFQFPENDGTTYQKILMYHTLKCFEGGMTAGGLGFPCGEWDYLTYNYLFDHTGELDSTFSTHPLYLLNNQGFTTTEVSYTPAFNVTRTTYPTVEEVAVENAAITQVGTNLLSSEDAFQTNKRRHRIQFLYTAEELIDFGLSAGWIGELALHTTSQVSGGGLLTLHMAATSAQDLTTWSSATMTNVYAGVFNPIADAANPLQFHAPFEWDGSSSLVFELRYTAAQSDGSTGLLGNDGTSVTVLPENSDRFMSFNGNAFVNVPPAAFSSLDEQVTIALWVKGNPGVQPANEYAFEGYNAANQRVLNSHLPWGNGRVYWDAGQSGGYDRIDKQAAQHQYAGQWNHWAFTKNAATGVMHIYLNGELWHSGEDRTRTMEGIVKFTIGSSAAPTSFYHGDIDDVAIWKTALDAETIAAHMLTGVDASHPAYADLLLHYTFDEADGEPVIDHSGNGFHGQVIGTAARVLYPAADLFLREAVINFRPAIDLSTGDYSIVTGEATIDEPWLAVPSSLSSYVVMANSVVISGIDYVYPAGQTLHVFDSEGNVLEDLGVVADLETVTNSTLEYFGVPFEVVDRYEIARYITPYGIGLTLGSDGWTWVFDVTDYEPLLHGMVELEAGNWQELLDLKFVFIEGTPPREVKRVEAFWKGQYNLSTFDEQVTAHTFTPSEGESTFRLKTRASGHGFGQGNNCGEFCNNMHSVKVNGTTHWSWEIIEECADNPLYPQGGTWIYDRAGWCPGAKVTTQDFEVTPFVQGQQSFTVDYDITWDPHGNYRMEGQVIAYGPHHFVNDVELEDILAPSNWKIYGRMNPICNKPIIRIRNNGSAPLTSCVITYGINGEMETYTWSGNLGFAQSEDVKLIYTNEELWFGEGEGNLLFSATVSQPNGHTDENPYNNTGTAPFKRVPVYSYNNLNDNRLIVAVTTNSVPWQNTSTLSTMNGTEVFSRNYTQPNFAYLDTVELNQGCYTFHLYDSAHNGLSFFANNEGNGNARLRRIGGLFAQFNANFGMEITQHFFMKTNVVSVEEEERMEPQLVVFPNPGREYFTLRVRNVSSAMQWFVYDLNGRMLKQGFARGVASGNRIDIAVPTAELAPGMYNVVIEDREHRISTRWVKN